MAYRRSCLGRMNRMWEREVQAGKRRTQIKDAKHDWLISQLDDGFDAFSARLGPFIIIEPLASTTVQPRTRLDHDTATVADPLSTNI